MPAKSRKILGIIGTLVGATVLVAVLYLWFADLSRFKPDIERAVTNATGREFRIDGDFELDALPRPMVIADGVTLANAPWSNAGDMVEVGHFSIKVGLWSLLFKPIVIHDLQIADVNVLLEVNADEQANWDLGGSEEETPPEGDESGDGEPMFDLRNADVQNVRLVYRQPDNDDVTVSLGALSAVTRGDGQQHAEMTAQLGEIPVTVVATIVDRDADIDATVGDARLKTRLHRADRGVDVDVSVSTLSDVGRLAAIENLPAEDLSLAGNVGARGTRLVFTDFVVGLGAATITVNGELDGGSQSADLALEAKADDLTFLSPDLPVLPLVGTAQLSMEGETMQLDPFELAFGDSELSGRLAIEGGDEGSVQLTARSALVDLTPFGADEGKVAEDSGAKTTGNAEIGRYVFKEEPLPLDALQSLRADIDLTIDQIRAAQGDFSDFRIIGTAIDGELNFENSFSGGRGGSYENEVELTTTAERADLVLKARARDLKLGLLADEDMSADEMPATSFDLDITANGASPRQLAASANGRMVFTSGAGRVKNSLIGRFSGDIIAQIFGALNPFSEKEEYSNWECTVFALDFESGLGTITGFLMQGEKLQIVGRGEIDLNTEKLGIEFNTKPREGVGVSADMFVTPFVAVSGTLANPGVGLNAKGALLSGGAAVLTGGLSFLYKGLVDRATAGADRCEETLAQTGVM